MCVNDALDFDYAGCLQEAFFLLNEVGRMTTD